MTQLNFTAPASSAPQAQAITLSGAPSVPFGVAVTTNSGPAGWLSVTPLQGQTPATLTVMAASLPSSTYTGAITITATDGSEQPIVIPVTYVVNAPGQVTTLGSMAHLAFNSAWSTTFSLVNTGTSPVQATLNFFDDNYGNPLPIPLVFPQQGSAAGPAVTSTTVTVNPGSGQLVQASGGVDQPLQQG